MLPQVFKATNKLSWNADGMSTRDASMWSKVYNSSPLLDESSKPQLKIL